MPDQLNELRILLTRAIIIINDLADKTELTDEQKGDFVIITDKLKRIETLRADENCQH